MDGVGNDKRDPQAEQASRGSASISSAPAAEPVQLGLYVVDR